MKAVVVASLLAALSAPTLAQQKAEEHAGHHSAASAPAADLTEGEVRKVDKDTRKLTIRHGEIKHLDMPPMTMVFQVKDAAMLEQVKAGDKIRFRVEKSDSGFVVTALQPAR
jgi:Cu(I)/Ag(I) efflux system periplasmic protein CusF